MPMESFTAQPGDVFRLHAAGGGGYGDPMKRRPERVAADARAGKVTREGALRDYGVVLDDALVVDEAATLAARAGHTGTGATA
jgi:N-methylhydantoinase B